MENSNSWLDDLCWIKSSDPDFHQFTTRASGGYGKPFDMQFHMEHVTRESIFKRVFYGNSWVNPPEMAGFSSLYNTMDPNKTQNATCVLDGGSRGAGLTSMWAVVWEPRRLCMATPDGNPIAPEGSKAALVPVDFRYAARFANIDPVSPRREVSFYASRLLLNLPSFQGKTVLYMNGQLYGKLGYERYRGVQVREVPLHNNEAAVTAEEKLAS